MAKNELKIVLAGNPNTGKTSLFNVLTGMTQKVGNYPGVTVDKKEGKCEINDQQALIIDLPGTYSMNPNSLDESVVLNTLLDKKGEAYPDAIVVVADISNLKRNLLLLLQIKDLGIPTLLAVNMCDEMEKKGISLDIEKLSSLIGCKIVLVSSRTGQGIDTLKSELLQYKSWNKIVDNQLFNKIDSAFFEEVKKLFPNENPYASWLLVSHCDKLPESFDKDENIIDFYQQNTEKIKQYHHKETIYRYQEINAFLKETYRIDKTKASDFQSLLDRILIHRVWGYAIFFALLFLIFQSIFDWASYPMDLIDGWFADLTDFTKSKLPEGVLTDLITDGIIAGIGGVVIFIPQIAILFLFVTLLEQTGYMSRIVFLMDKIMRKFGMNGKSIFPLISGTACAIPAVMASRTIGNWKERLITILVTPFTTCSARLPVYAILIALIIPEKRWGIINLQGVTLFGLYVLGFVTAILSSMILHKVLKTKESNLFLMEMPTYKVPLLKNVLLEVFGKVMAFLKGAGTIILALSVILWFLASNGGNDFQQAETIIKSNPENKSLNEEEIDQKIASFKLENSYIGVMGKTIEPIIKPMGYDWKIGIALISSFAAREVFVGTLATIYNVGSDDEDTATIKERMQAEINPDTGKKRFDFATGMSLLLYYAYAMQCIGTVAIVKRETKSWKWPIIQLVFMGLLAYISAIGAYQFLS
ncbi:MAG: ferrous iron transport protein B [Flavobacteriaceae bacterium]|nr:ferrous iron transport protein B [Flavobacteriaceae bacterium]